MLSRNGKIKKFNFSTIKKFIITRAQKHWYSKLLNSVSDIESWLLMAINLAGRWTDIKIGLIFDRLSFHESSHFFNGRNYSLVCTSGMSKYKYNFYHGFNNLINYIHRWVRSAVVLSHNESGCPESIGRCGWLYKGILHRDIIMKEAKYLILCKIIFPWITITFLC